MRPFLAGRRTATAVLLTCLVVAPSQPPVVARQTAAAVAVSIPFELATRHVIVQVSVNKSRPLSFVLDTGAAAAIVRMDVAKDLGLPLQGTVNTSGAGAGRQEGRFVKDATWSLIGLSALDQTARRERRFDGLLAAPDPQLVSHRFFEPFLNHRQRE